MPFIWKVKYKTFTDTGSNSMHKSQTKENLFITNTKDLEEIEEKKKIVHQFNHLYSYIYIEEAEFIGQAEDLQQLERAKVSA